MAWVAGSCLDVCKSCLVGRSWCIHTRTAKLESPLLLEASMKNPIHNLALLLAFASAACQAAQPSASGVQCQPIGGRADYPGRYQLVDGRDLDIVESNGRYFAVFNAGKRLTLVETEAGELSARRGGLTIRFCNRSAGVAYDLAVTEGGGRPLAGLAQAGGAGARRPQSR